MKYFFCSLVFTLLSLVLLSPLQADMISNQQLLEQPVIHSQFLPDQHRALHQKLVALGVDPQLAENRISRLTPEEAALLEERLDELPAGSGLLGAALIVFVLFVITDMIGATDIFPFVRSIND